MKLASILLTTLALVSAGARAESIRLSDLGSLRVEFAAVVSANEFPGRPMAAQASFRPGEALSLVTPARVRQISYRHPPGTAISKGEVIARLDGPEIHHFTTEFQVLEARLAAAQRRYNSNLKLYQRQAIDEGRWIEISDAFHALQLEYEHMRHFHELLSPDDAVDALWLQSPADGLLHYQQSSPGLAAGGELALVIPPDALRLRVAVPLAQRQQLRALSFADCTVSVDAVSAVARDFFVEAWSAPLRGDCALLPGERLMVTPMLAAPGYLLPQGAVIQWRGEATVLVKNGDALETVAVNLLAHTGDHYFVSCNDDLAGRSVLTTSVSAVQGLLLGLGGE